MVLSLWFERAREYLGRVVRESRLERRDGGWTLVHPDLAPLPLPAPRGIAFESLHLRVQQTLPAQERAAVDEFVRRLLDCDAVNTKVLHRLREIDRRIRTGEIQAGPRLREAAGAALARVRRTWTAGRILLWSRCLETPAPCFGAARRLYREAGGRAAAADGMRVFQV